MKVILLVLLATSFLASYCMANTDPDFESRVCRVVNPGAGFRGQFYYYKNSQSIILTQTANEVVRSDPPRLVGSHLGLFEAFAFNDIFTSYDAKSSQFIFRDVMSRKIVVYNFQGKACDSIFGEAFVKAIGNSAWRALVDQVELMAGDKKDLDYNSIPDSEVEFMVNQLHDDAVNSEKYWH